MGWRKWRRISWGCIRIVGKRFRFLYRLSDGFSIQLDWFSSFNVLLSHNRCKVFKTFLQVLSYQHQKFNMISFFCKFWIYWILIQIWSIVWLRTVSCEMDFDCQKFDGFGFSRQFLVMVVNNCLWNVGLHEGYFSISAHQKDLGKTFNIS